MPAQRTTSTDRLIKFRHVGLKEMHRSDPQTHHLDLREFLKRLTRQWALPQEAPRRTARTSVPKHACPG